MVPIILITITWNSAASILVRKLAPALAAGYSVVVKADVQTAFSASAFTFLAEKAGVPAGIINIVHALYNTPTVGKALYEHPVLLKLSFTRSTRINKVFPA